VSLFLKKNVMPIIYVIASKGHRTDVNTGAVMLEPPLSVEIFSYCKTSGHAGSLGELSVLRNGVSEVPDQQQIIVDKVALEQIFI